MITVCINFILERVGLILLGNYPLHGSDGNGVLRYSVRALLMNLLGVQSGWFSEGDSYAVNGPSWFLSVLFLCYLIHFLLIRMIGNERTRKIVYVLFVTVGIILMLHPLFIAISLSGKWQRLHKLLSWCFDVCLSGEGSGEMEKANCDSSGIGDGGDTVCMCDYYN